MFDILTQRIQNIFDRIKRRGRLSEADIQEVLREIRVTLLEADVNYKVVKDFLERVKAKALQESVLKSVSPGDQILKIIYEELISLLGGEVRAEKHLPTVVMLVGLQGAGKTTAAGKLAVYYRKRQGRPLLVACDTRRPAAVQQLEIIGNSINIPVYKEDTDPVTIAVNAVKFAREKVYEPVILDTSGRLHIDNDLMEELKETYERVKPQEVFLVVDAMTGQDAVNIGESFVKFVPLTGIILTKMDGDARGGSALSMRAVTGVPVVFIGTGEKFDAIEPFYPDRMASRILGMGDIKTLVEKVEEAASKERAEKSLEKFTLVDFMEQLKEIRNMGPLDQVMGLIPGFSKLTAKLPVSVDEKKLKRIESIIGSMTIEERENPNIINASRKRRIASGSGTTVQEVNQLLKQYEQIKNMIKQFSHLEKKGRFPLLGGRI
ncbi:MAG TPA: signal recognition particle protein [bacterium]|mgnify:CR=1 FL=1|jgi:signal recognition particle subunit SRP54|nr:signal recognition particle protein [bacterium]HOP55555.1 signal recognition particle protein [bacterium]